MPLKAPISILAFCFLMLSAANSFAQSNPLDKKLGKAQELVQDNKTDDAEKYVVKLLAEYPDFGDGWDMLASIRYLQYKDTKPLQAQISVTAKDEKGKEVTLKNDSLTNQLMEMLSKISLPQIAYSKYIYTLRKATAMSKDAVRSCMLLRRIFVDINVDSNVNKKALKYFNEGDEEFSNKNYTKAATLYKRATEEQPEFYKAQMYLGDCYYATKDYTEAINAFRIAKDKYPDLLEPSKYLTDALGKLGQYEKAYDEAVRSFTIYPDFSMAMKMDDAAYMTNKKVNIIWTPRGVLPNKVEDTGKNGLNEYSDHDTAADGSPWKYYQAANDKINRYCDKNGIITKSNDLTKSRYMEVYGWEEMLKNSTDPLLNEARKMEKQNFLDCYVLVTCFHYDFYDQYLDFIAHNRDKVARYYNTFTKAR